MAAPSGEGIEALRAALERAASGAGGRGGARRRPLRLHVDRSFTIRGAGTVVTGTLWSGTAARGDEVLILPPARPPASAPSRSTMSRASGRRPASASR